MKTLKGFANRRTLSGFNIMLCSQPRVVATLQPWAGISERLRRFTRFQLSRTFDVPTPSAFHAPSAFTRLQRSRAFSVHAPSLLRRSILPGPWTVLFTTGSPLYVTVEGPETV